MNQKTPTVEQKITELLEERGLFPDEAAAIVAITKTENSPAIHWSDHVEDYPEPVLVTLWTYARQTAIKHLRETAPEHFCLAVLEENP